MFPSAVLTLEVRFVTAVSRPPMFVSAVPTLVVRLLIALVFEEMFPSAVVSLAPCEDTVELNEDTVLLIFEISVVCPDTVFPKFVTVVFRVPTVLSNVPIEPSVAVTLVPKSDIPRS